MSEGQETNGGDREAVRPIPLWKLHGISQGDCDEALKQSEGNMRKLNAAENKIDRALNIVELLLDAAGVTDDLTLRALEQLDQVQSLLKSAAKKIDKYGNEQKIRDIENWKQRGAS